MRTRSLGLAAALALAAASAHAQNVPLDFRFSYQGELRLNGVVVDQPSDLRFALFDQPVGGNQISFTNSLNAVPVTRGVFEVELDFGNVAFAGDQRHLEIAVRSPAGVGTFTTLSPRVELTPTPNAHFSRFAGLAFDAFELDGLDSTDFVQKGEASTITSAMIVPGNVTQSSLQNGSVSTAKIQPGAVTNNEIAAATITGAKIADGGIGAADLANGSVNSAKIVDGTVTLADLATNSVDSSKIVNGSVTAADLAAGAIDGGDADTVDGLQGNQFLRSDANDIITGNTVWSVIGGSPNSLTIGGGNLELFLGDTSADRTTVIGGFAVDGTSVELNESTLIEALDTNADFDTDLTIHGGTSNLFTLNLGAKSSDVVEVKGFLDIGNIITFKKDGPKRLRFETAAGVLETNFSFEPIPNSFDMNDNFRIGGNGTFTVGAPIGSTFTPLSFNSFGGNTTPPGSSDISTQDDLRVDDSLEVGDDIYLGTFSGDPTIYFQDSGSVTANWFRWDDTTNITGCSALPAVTSAFVSNIGNNSNTGWVFQNSASDNELVLHANGNLELDGSVTSAGSCDVAETFFGDADLEPGTVVTLDPGQVEGVRESRRAYDPALVGVVSTRPGLLLSGPSSDAYPMFDEMDRARVDAAADPDDEGLARRVDDLEAALDSWARGEVAVALAGRVPVKVVGPVELGQPLTSSDVAGHAMAMDRPGPSIGIAMEDKSSAGAGTVLVLVARGFATPTTDADEPEREAVAGGRADDDRVAALEARLAKVEQRVVRGDDGRRGPDGRDAADAAAGREGADGRDGRDALDRAAGPVVRIEKEAWGDVDGDGLDDVAVLDGAGLTLLRSLGSGSFQDVTETAGLGDVDGVRIALLEDVDLDRNVDLLVVDADGAARLLQGSGAFAFTDVTAAFGLDFGQPIVEARFLDHDRDDRPDLRVELADGTLLLHHNLGAGAFRTTTLRPALTAADASAADARVAELEAQVAALTEMVEALAAAKGGR